MGIEDESNLSQPDFCEKTKKLNMSTTRVEMCRTEVKSFTFDIPTHVAEWCKADGTEPEIDENHENHWEVRWDRGWTVHLEERTWGKVMKIPKGEVEWLHDDLDDIEYTEIDEAEEMRKKAEFWEKRAKYCEKQVKRLEAKKAEAKKEQLQIDREIIDRLELDY
jgi:hypothetical protein